MVAVNQSKRLFQRYTGSGKEESSSNVSSNYMKPLQ